MASLLKRDGSYQVAVCYELRRYKLPGWSVDAVGRELSAELGRNVTRLLQCKASGAIPPDLRRYIERLPSRTRRSMAKQSIIDPIAEGKKLPQHVADYETALLAKGNTAQHVAVTASALRVVFEATQCQMLGELKPEKVRAFLAARRADKYKLDANGKPVLNVEGEKVIEKRGISARRHNAILTALGGFFRWCIRERRAFENPIIHVPRLNEKTDKRHPRRALTAAEVRELLATAEGAGELYGITGAERAFVYRTAVESGLRMTELSTLRRSCLDLDALTLTVRAGYSKHRREDVVPIRTELAALLTEHVKHKAPTARLFNMPNKYRMLDAFKADLSAARDKWLGDAKGDELSERMKTDYLLYKNADGLFADFHAFRHTFISSLADAGVHPKTAQSLARHSTITLTMDRYTHTLRGAEARALTCLPDYATPEAAGATRTGTDDVPVDAVAEARKSNGNTPATNETAGRGGKALAAAVGNFGGKIRGARGTDQCRNESTVDNPPAIASRIKNPEILGENPQSQGTAGGGSRTHTPLRTMDFESIAPSTQTTNLPVVTDSGEVLGGKIRGTEGANSPISTIKMDADLRAVAEAWETLPAALKAGILAMVRAARG
jgi:integrase